MKYLEVQRLWRFILVLATCLIAPTGCRSEFELVVSNYRGDLLSPSTGDLVTNSFAHASKIYAISLNDSKWDSLKKEYENSGLAELRKHYLEEKTKDFENIGKKLKYFAQFAQNDATPIGIEEFGRGLFMDRKLVGQALAIEEFQRQIKNNMRALEIRTAAGFSRQAMLSLVVNSQDPDILMKQVAKLDSAWADTYDSQTWERLGTVKLEGSGDTLYSVVKDPTGNWSAREVKADPTKIIEATEAVASTTIRIVARALKVTLPASSAPIMNSKTLKANVDTLAGDIRKIQGTSSSGGKEKKERLLAAITDALKRIATSSANPPASSPSH